MTHKLNPHIQNKAIRKLAKRKTSNIRKYEWCWFVFSQITWYVHSVVMKDLVDSLFLALAKRFSDMQQFLFYFIFFSIWYYWMFNVHIFNQCECTLSQSHYKSFKLKFCYSNLRKGSVRSNRMLNQYSLFLTFCRWKIWIYGKTTKCRKPSMRNECCKRW